MKKYKLSKEWIRENNEMIKEAFNTASDRGFDIASRNDMFKLLKIVDPKNASLENAEVISNILQLFARQLGKRLTQKTKEKIVN